MFVGHYSAAFVAKGVEPRIPLWALLLAAQFVDVIWGGFVLMGVEKLRLDPSLATTPLDLYFMPYTHSLLATFVWAGVAFAIVKSTKSMGGTVRAATVVALAVAAHWFLDLIVHRPDLPLVGDGTLKLGFGLWNYPVPAFALEMILLLAGISFYVRASGIQGPARRGALGLASGFLVLQLVWLFGPLPPSPQAVAVMGLATFLIVAWAGGRVERWMNKAASTPGVTN